jgi:hypothetical protein
MLNKKYGDIAYNIIDVAQKNVIDESVREKLALRVCLWRLIQG